MSAELSLALRERAVHAGAHAVMDKALSRTASVAQLLRTHVPEPCGSFA